MNDALAHDLILSLAGPGAAFVGVLARSRLARHAKQTESRFVEVIENRREKKRFPRKQTVQCTFERLILVRGIPYWVYWPLAGLAVFVLGETFARSINDDLFFWARVIFSLGIATVPTVHIWLSYSFEETMREALASIWKRNAGLDDWLGSSKKNIFTLHSRLGKIITGAVVAFGLLTVLTLGVPLEGPFYSTLGLLVFAPFLFICGQALHIAIALLSHLVQMVRMPVNVPFYLMPTNSLFKLRSYYLALGFSILSFYIALVFAIWQGPYGFHPLLLFWLFALAFYPLGILSVSLFQIRALMRNIKEAHVRRVNREIQRALERSINNSRNETLDRLERLMDIQDRIQKMKEWL